MRNVLKTIPELRQRYHGVEFQFNTRLTKATVFGGFTIGNNSGDQDNGDLNNPNVRINNQGDIGFDSPYQIRGGFSYQLPAGLQLSGSLREASGLPQTRTYRRDDDAGAGPDAGHAERPGGRARRVPLSVGASAWICAIAKSFRSGSTRFEPTVDISTSSTTMPSPTPCRPSARHSAGRQRSSWGGWCGWADG